jgi:hypothetical protein
VGTVERNTVDVAEAVKAIVPQARTRWCRSVPTRAAPRSCARRARPAYGGTFYNVSFVGTAMNLIEPILADAAAITAMRRDIHAHPELCFQEERTADVIAKALTDWGIPIHRGLGKTGVVGIVKNGTSSRAARWACAPTSTRCR